MAEQIKSFATPSSSPLLDCFDGDYIWHLDGGTSIVYKLDRNGTVVTSWGVVVPLGTAYAGMCTDGRYLYIATQARVFTNNVCTIRVYNNTGTLVRSYTGHILTASFAFNGLEFDGNNLLLGSTNTTTGVNAIYVLGRNPTGTSATLIRTMPLTVGGGHINQGSGFCFDNLRIVSVGTGVSPGSYQLHYISRNEMIVKSKLIATTPRDITFDRQHYWLVDDGTNAITMNR